MRKHIDKLLESDGIPVRSLLWCLSIKVLDMTLTGKWEYSYKSNIHQYFQILMMVITKTRKTRVKNVVYACFLKPDL